MEINSFFSTDWKLIVGFLESGLSIKDKEENGWSLLIPENSEKFGVIVL